MEGRPLDARDMEAFLDRSPVEVSYEPTQLGAAGGDRHYTTPVEQSSRVSASGIRVRSSGPSVYEITERAA